MTISASSSIFSALSALAVPVAYFGVLSSSILKFSVLLYDNIISMHLIEGVLGFWGGMNSFLPLRLVHYKASTN